MEIYQALEPDLGISRCWISSKKKKREKGERKPVISRYRFSKINLDRIKIDWQTVLHLPPRSRPMVWRGYGAGASRRCLRPVRSFETSFPGGPPENVTFHVRRRTYAPLLSRDSSRKSPPSISSTFTFCFQPGGNAGKINCVANFISFLLFSISVFTRWVGKVTAMTIDYWKLGKEKNNFEY